jgi:drug/metabolite transporter (DMT)-like permease
LKYGLAGAGGVVVTTLNPIFTFILAAIIFKNNIRLKEIIGIVLGFIGGVILIEIWRVKGDYLLTSGNLFFILAASSWASLSVVSQHSKKSVSPIVFTFYIIVLATFIDFFIALPYGIFEPLNFGFVFWFNILYLAIFALTFATTIYFIGTTNIGAHKASSFIFLVPVSAVIISWMTLGEVPRTSTIIGGLIGITAVYLINSRLKNNNIVK